jgi:hypothetical protein
MIVIEGELSIQNVERFYTSLSQLLSARHKTSSPWVLELNDMEIEDGPSVAEMVNIIRAHRPIVLHNAPQMLAHTLYKTGLLQDGSIQLRDPREDEGWGAG